MKIVLWVLRIVVFVLLFGLAIKNGGSVELRFFLDQHWQWPLSLILLAAFAAGSAVGVSAALATLVRQRREINRLRRTARRDEEPGEK